VKHSFASRDPSQEAIIIAVTYGGSVRKALQDFGRMEGSAVERTAGDAREPEHYRQAVLQRYLADESLSEVAFTDRLSGGIGGGDAISASRAEALLGGAEPSSAEVTQMAEALMVDPAELLVNPLRHRFEVALSRGGLDGSSSISADPHYVQKPAAYRLGDEGGSGYDICPLARTPHQSQLKTMDVAVKADASEGPLLQTGLHQFMYVHGSTPVELEWGDEAEEKHRTLQPGDSVYVAPMVPHRFSGSSDQQAEEVEDGRVYIVRIPGQLTNSTWKEFATFEARGRQRVGKESMQWYN